MAAVDLSPGHREKHVLRLGIMEFGGVRPWGQETQSHGLKVLALAFCKISGLVSLVGSGIFLRKARNSVVLALSCETGCLEPAGAESKLDVESFQEGPAVVSSSETGPEER